METRVSAPQFAEGRLRSLGGAFWMRCYLVTQKGAPKKFPEKFGRDEKERRTEYIEAASRSLAPPLSPPFLIFEVG
jgi:hypothetical protein